MAEERPAQTIMSNAPDAMKAQAFAGRMMTLLNDSFLGILISIGHQSGLFDAMSELPPSTSEAVARAAGLQERHVREWLGGMVVGRIVDYQPADGTYHLPPEHAGFLTRAAGANNFAFFTQYIRVAGCVEGEVLSAFREGGGIPYDKYPDFQRLQAEESARLFDSALVPAILPLAPGLRERFESGIDAVDIGTGQGHAVNLLAKTFPKSQFLGMDFSAEGIDCARAEAARMQLKNARFEAGDPTEALPGQFDLVTAFDVIHDLAKPGLVLANIARALRPGGVFLMMDMAASSRLEENLDHPAGPMMYAASVVHCMMVSLAQEGEGLGAVWGEQRAREYLQNAGFSQVSVQHLEGDPMHVFYVARV